jgi:membrane protease YdiL (CAAX protease family)
MANPMTPLHEPTPLLPLRVLLSAVLVNILCVLWLLLVVVPSGALQTIRQHSAGWLTPSLLANVLMLALVAGIVLCAWGRLSPHALGLRRSELVPAARVLLGGWLLLNLVAGLWQLATQGELSWAAAWRERGYASMLGGLLAQLVGNALYEEVLYRSVLLRQLYWRSARSPRAALLIAMVVSQALFALMHIVTFLAQGDQTLLALGRALSVFCAGCAFAWLYLTTGKLLVVVSVHALVNAPTLLVTDPFGYDNLPLLVVMCMLARFAVAPARDRSRPQNPEPELTEEARV